MSTINFALVGCGGITLQNHLPGLAFCPEVRVTALCDADPRTLENARQQTGASIVSTNYADIVTRDDVHAVIIATPNHTHLPVAGAERFRRPFNGRCRCSRRCPPHDGVDLPVRPCDALPFPPHRSG